MILNLFHKHELKSAGYKIYYRHSTEKRNWKKYGKDVCPYLGCTKRFNVYRCFECGKIRETEVVDGDNGQIEIYEY